MKSQLENKKSLYGLTALTFLSSAGLLLTAPSPSQAQVVIEGGPGVIQISDRDGKPEPVVSGAVPNGAKIPLEKNPPGAATLDLNSKTLRPDPTSPVEVLVPVVKAGVNAPNRVTLPAAAAPAVAPVDVEAEKRKGELIRELGIADSGAGATIALFTENLFEGNTPEVTTVASTQLFLISEFIGLCDEESVTVTYHYAPALHEEGLAWRRSVRLVEWFKLSGGLSGTKFTIAQPLIVTAPSPTEETGDADTALPRNRVVIVVDYR